MNTTKLPSTKASHLYSNQQYIKGLFVHVRTNTLLSIFFEKFDYTIPQILESLESLQIFIGLLHFSLKCLLLFSSHVSKKLSISYWFRGAPVTFWILVPSLSFKQLAQIFPVYFFFYLYGIDCHIEIFNLYIFLFWFLLWLFCHDPPQLLILWYWR